MVAVQYVHGVTSHHSDVLLRAVRMLAAVGDGVVGVGVEDTVMAVWDTVPISTVRRWRLTAVESTDRNRLGRT